MKIGPYESHPIADAFPRMRDAEIAGLTRDIETNGLHRKPVLFEGKILDGINRCRAMVALGREIEFEAFVGDMAAAIRYAWSLNGERRDLDEYERRRARKCLDAMLKDSERKAIKEARSKQVALRGQDSEADHVVDSVMSNKSNACAELKEAVRTKLIGAYRAAEVMDAPHEEQRAYLERIKAAIAEPERRAKTEPKNEFVSVVVAYEGVDSVRIREALVFLKHHPRFGMKEAAALMSKAFPWND